MTALIWSATDLEKVRLLLMHGANPNLATKRGRSALLIAARSDQSEPIVRLLLEKGADAKAADAFKTTTLRGAAMGNDTATMRLLIDAGVDVNAGDLPGLTPLMMAAGWNGNLSAVELLLKKGAKINAVSAPVMGLPSKNGPSEFGTFTALLMAAPFGPPDLIWTTRGSGSASARRGRRYFPYRSVHSIAQGLWADGPQRGDERTNCESGAMVGDFHSGDSGRSKHAVVGLVLGRERRWARNQAPGRCDSRETTARWRLDAARGTACGRLCNR